MNLFAIKTTVVWEGEAIVWYCKSASYLVLAVTRTEAKRRTKVNSFVYVPWLAKSTSRNEVMLKNQVLFFCLHFPELFLHCITLEREKWKLQNIIKSIFLDDSCFLVDRRGSWSYSLMYFTDGAQNWTTHVHHGFIWPNTVQRFVDLWLSTTFVFLILMFIKSCWCF